MKKLNPILDNAPLDGQSADLARRLARYRSRVEAEGRKRSLKIIDLAIEDVGKDTRASRQSG
jgi:hypothetical protein